MPEAVIVSTARSAIGRAHKGGLKDVRPDDLAATVVQAALDKVPGLDPADIDDLLMGCARPDGQQGNNLARVVGVLLGFDHLPGTTLNRYCSSSLQTTRMAMHAIRAGEGDVFISAGVESVSNFIAPSQPERVRNPRFAEAVERSADAQKGGEGGWRDPREDGALPDVYIGMGDTAENVALLCDVSREEMDAFSARSQELTAKAQAAGFWDLDVVPITTPDGTVVSKDESPRAGTTPESLAALKPVFRPDGRVTAGNACPLNDGAAAVVVMSDTKAEALGLQPLARVVSTAVTSVSPEIMGLGPVDAVKLALHRAGLTVDDIDLFELNEAFAAQVIPCYQQLGIPLEKLNVHGGAIAVGHPFGMTGARMTGTLLNGLSAVDGRYGLESMCVAGGMGMAMVLERLT